MTDSEHRPKKGWGDSYHCRQCREDWPCAVDRLTSTLRAAEAEIGRLRGLLQETYDYAVQTEGLASVIVMRQPGMASLPGTEESRTELGGRVRAALAASVAGGEKT
jgi:hypothetical protein